MYFCIAKHIIVCEDDIANKYYAPEKLYWHVMYVQFTKNWLADKFGIFGQEPLYVFGFTPTDQPTSTN